MIFSHESVDAEKDNPPLRSMKIIDRQFSRMERSGTKVTKAAANGGRR